MCFLVIMFCKSQIDRSVQSVHKSAELLLTERENEKRDLFSYSDKRDKLKISKTIFNFNSLKISR